MIALLYYGRDFFVTLIISAVFAFILDPVVELIMKLRVPRAFATLIVIATTGTLVYLLCLVAWTQMMSIREDLPTYSSRVSELLDKANDGLDELEKKTIALVVPKNLRQQEEQIPAKASGSHEGQASQSWTRSGSSHAADHSGGSNSHRSKTSPWNCIHPCFPLLSRHGHGLVCTIPGLLHA